MTRPDINYALERKRHWRGFAFGFAAMAIAFGIIVALALIAREWVAVFLFAPSSAYMAYHCADCHRRAAAFARGEWPA